MNSAADTFAWPFQDPDWFGKIILQGLIGIIPIVGQISGYGWLMMTIDNYRAGRRELPPAGFHLERGITIFLVYLVYAIVIFLPGIILGSIGSANNGQGLSGLGSLAFTAGGLFLAFLLPAVYLNTYRGGFTGGFDVAAVWAVATLNPSTTIVAGLLIIVAGIVGGLGFFACWVGLLFTVPYSYAIVAGVVTWYEKALSGPAQTPAQPG